MITCGVMGAVSCGGTGMVSCKRIGMVSCGGMETVSCGIVGIGSCRGTAAVSCGGMGAVSCGGMGTAFCVTIAALVFVRMRRFAFETFEPIRRVSCGQNEGSWALLRPPQRSGTTFVTAGHDVWANGEESLLLGNAFHRRPGDSVAWSFLPYW